MFYRENGQFKTTYRADQQVFPILQDRFAIALVLLVTLLSWVFAQFGNDSAVYGVAAGAVSGLIGVYTAIYIVVLGAIINAQWPSELRVANLWPRRKNRKSSG